MADGSVLPPFNLARSTAKKHSSIKPGIMQGKPMPEVKNKYTHIQGNLNTGPTADRVGIVPDRRGEIFERVSRTLLAQIITSDDQAEENVFELAELNASPTSAAHHGYYQHPTAPYPIPASTALSPAPTSPTRGSMYSFEPAVPPSPSTSTYMAHYQSQANGTTISRDPVLHTSPSRFKHVGAAAAAAATAANAPHEPDFLLLDIRSDEEYNACHIRAAGSFPLSNLRQDRTTAALVRIRTDPNKVLILYDNDEKQAQQAALLLLGKQYTSVAILTGGLAKFAEKFPELLVGPSTAAFAAPPQTTRPARSSLAEASSKLTASALAAHGSPVRLHVAPSTQGSARMAPSVAGGASVASRRTAVSTASRASHISKSRFVSVGAAMAHMHIADVAPPTALQRLRDKLSVGVDVGHDQVSTASAATRRTAQSMRR